MVSSSSWRFRAAADTAAEAERFTALSNSLYARPVTPAYYRWQFHQPPFPSELTLAEGADQTLAGAYAFHHREANDSHSLAMALDIMITPAAQGTGLFRQLYQAAVERARGRSPSALYVMANQRAAAVHAGALGWSQVQTFRDYVAP
ncbi:MAG TPA: GNAT family N-acetyltransferase, partial [Gemmatimonadales bacterium]|nr:GNAT family N-acetyltransferase [Gemmatimonadales bacterium]